jgi:hypothetical protein
MDGSGVPSGATSQHTMSSMKTTVFFSWQTDTPAREGRNFIEKALKNAIKKIASDTDVEHAIREELELDKDTLGVPGSPAIVDTILGKIDNATVFLPDLTFIGKRPDGRPTPNPNVLIEYGWALKSIGLPRMLPVMNAAFGKPTWESMPFDMAHLRFPIAYTLPEDATDEQREEERKGLEKRLGEALKTFFSSDEFKATLPKPEVDSIQELISSMPALTDEMRTDLQSPDGATVREFFVLPNRQVMLGGSSKPRFVFYEDVHPTIMSQLDLLEEHGLVKDVTPAGNRAKIYRMSEKLVAQLLDNH